MTESKVDSKAEQKTMPGSTPTEQDLRHEVELTRDELAGTVSALAGKLDVKSRTTDSMRRQVANARAHPAVVGGSALGLLGLIVVLLTVKRRGRAQS